LAVDVNLGHLQEAVFVKFFHCKELSPFVFSPAPIQYSLEGNHYAKPTLRMEYLYNLFGILQEPMHFSLSFQELT
jgi:hypothetical protein